MKKFNFRLGGYLRIKEFEEKNAWNEVLKQEKRTQSLKDKIDDLTMDIHNTRLATVDTSQAVPQWALADEAIRGMTARITELQKEYAVEMKTLEKLVLKHRETKKEAKIVNNYKDRKKNEFEEEKNKIEDKQRIDISTQSFMRKGEQK
jgi:flagellar export protein FliJ